MSQLLVNKEAFESYLDQFEGDPQYQARLVKRILDRMPEHVVVGLLEELYYSYAYHGSYYMATHCVFKDDFSYFQTLGQLKEFLKSKSRPMDEQAIDRLTDRVVLDCLAKGKPIFGYYVTKGTRR